MVNSRFIVVPKPYTDEFNANFTTKQPQNSCKSLTKFHLVDFLKDALSLSAKWQVMDLSYHNETTSELLKVELKAEPFKKGLMWSM